MGALRTSIAGAAVGLVAAGVLYGAVVGPPADVTARTSDGRTLADAVPPPSVVTTTRSSRPSVVPSTTQAAEPVAEKPVAQKAPERPAAARPVVRRTTRHTATPTHRSTPRRTTSAPKPARTTHEDAGEVEHEDAEEHEVEHEDEDDD